jgi:hypothetical protein
MARVETRDRPAGPVDEGGDEHLDDWFARRLQTQGIPARLGGAPTSRALAVLGLVLAMVAFLWALSSVGAHSSSSSPPVPTTPNPGTGFQTGGGNGKQTGKVTWKTVKVDILNGFGGNGAAASAASQLKAKGWDVGATGNATNIAATEVVYAPGQRKQAKLVARKLGLPAPVPIAQATGVPAGATTGVAIVLGPDQLTTVTP